MYPHEVTDDYGALSVRVSTYLIIFGLVLLLLVIAFIRESAANARHNRETQRQMIEALGQMAALRVASGEGPHGPAVQESHAVGVPVLGGGARAPYHQRAPWIAGAPWGGATKGCPPLATQLWRRRADTHWVELALACLVHRACRIATTGQGTRQRVPRKGTHCFFSLPQRPRRHPTWRSQRRRPQWRRPLHRRR